MCVYTYCDDESNDTPKISEEYVSVYVSVYSYVYPYVSVYVVTMFLP